MATVPYKPYSEVPASQQAIQNVEIPTPAAAFGSSIASAIESVGKTAERASDEIFQRALAFQQLQNETEAREAITNAEVEMGERRAQYNALEGKDSVEGYRPFIQDMQAIRDKHRSALKNPMVQRMYDRDTQTFVARNIFNGAERSAQQQRRWAEGAAAGRQAAATNDALTTTDPRSFDAAVRNAEQASREQSAVRGEDKDLADVKAKQAISNVYVERIRGMSDEDAIEARNFLEKNKDKIWGKDLDNITQWVQRKMYQQGSRRISDEVNNQPIEGGENLETRIERGMELARQKAPNDEDFAGFVRDRIITDYNRMGSVRRETLLERRNTIEGALMGNYGNGKIPTSIEELRATDPKVAQAWDRLDEKTQRQYLGIMAKNAKGEVQWTTEGMRRYEQLKGMAHTNPGEFLDNDMASENMPFSARRSLIEQQIKMRQRPEADPRVARALQQLRPMLTSAGIGPTIDKERYQQFVGALQDQLYEFQQKGKPPNFKETEEIGLTLLRNQREPGRIFGDFWQRRTPMFELSLPANLLQEFKNDPRWQGETPTDADIEMFRRNYIRKRYQELFGGSTSGGAGATPVPTTSYPQVPQSK